MARVKGVTLVSRLVVRLSILLFVGFGIQIAPLAWASPCPLASCIITDFNIDVIQGTLNVENASGTVLETYNDIWISNGPIPADLATGIATDTSITVPAFTQDNLADFDGGTDFDFAANLASGYLPMLLNVNGLVVTSTACSSPASVVCPAIENDLETISLAPVVSATASFLNNDQYLVEGYNSNDTEYVVSVVNANIYNDVIVEQETSAVPESSPAVLVGCGALCLALLRRARVLRLAGSTIWRETGRRRPL
jgi:hypothetical protein